VIKQLVTLAVSIVACLAPSARAADSGARRPNIILIMADDLGREGLSCYGSLSYKTPNLDAIASGGIRFANAYSTPLCSPSRAAIMTGRYGFRTGWNQLIGRGGEDALEFFDPDKEKTFGHVMKSAGYVTGITGKWQLARFDERPNHMAECGFDEYCMWTWQYGGKRTSRYWDPSIWQDGKVRADTKGRYGPEVFAEWAEGFITRNKDNPFFLYYPMVLTHGPFEPTPDSRKDGAAPAAKGPRNGGERGPGRKARREGSVEDGESDGRAAEFPAMVAYMDKNVGRIVETVRWLGLEENTLILFTADNGSPKEVVTRISTPTGERKLRGGKGQMTNSGSHVALIASWKGTAPAGKVSDQLIDFTDLLPTLAELGGASLPKGITIDGQSFAATLRGQAGAEREWVFTQLGNRKWVRDKRWRLLGSGELYDLQNDPWEERPIPSAEAGERGAARERLTMVMQRLKP
jgi:arylsulfatase A